MNVHSATYGSGPVHHPFWMFATPMRTSTLLSGHGDAIRAESVVGVVEGFGGHCSAEHWARSMIAVSAAAAVLLLVSGAFYFRRMEKTFADVV